MSDISILPTLSVIWTLMSEWVNLSGANSKTRNIDFSQKVKMFLDVVNSKKFKFSKKEKSYSFL